MAAFGRAAKPQKAILRPLGARLMAPPPPRLKPKAWEGIPSPRKSPFSASESPVPASEKGKAPREKKEKTSLRSQGESKRQWVFARGPMRAFLAASKSAGPLQAPPSLSFKPASRRPVKPRRSARYSVNPRQPRKTAKSLLNYTPNHARPSRTHALKAALYLHICNKSPQKTTPRRLKIRLETRLKPPPNRPATVK